MGRMIFILIVAVFMTGTAWTVQEPGFAEIDSLTYELYMKGSWKELIRKGEKALKQGNDYYYLRMRLGIASYETKDYSRAMRHFRKALEFNSADDTAREYLYFASTFYGRDMEAHNVALEFSASLQNKLSYERSVVRSLSFNATGSFLQDPLVIDGYSINADQAIDGLQSVTRNFRFFGASLEHDAGRHLKINHSIGYLSKSYLLYTQHENETDLTRDARLSQFQYYLSGRILLGSGAYLVPAIHYLNVIIPYETTVAGRFGRAYRVQQHDFNHDVAASLGLEKYFGKFRPGLSAGYSRINNHPQMQGSFTFSWFPYGNLNLYSVSDITGYAPLSGNETDRGWIVSQDIGFRVFPGLWVEFGGSIGERENFAGPRAYHIYNDPVVTRERYGVALIAPFYKSGMELALHYIYTLQESRFNPEDFEPVNPINPIKINNHIISGGIKWKF
jgi:tetratricopeptide (TPR) repeat protein